MAIIQDIKLEGMDSVYVERPFDEAKKELEDNGYHMVSLEEFAKLRIAKGKEHHVSNYGSYAKEGFLYVPQKGIFLVRDSPILTNSKKATNGHRNGNEFYLTPEQVESSLADSKNYVQFKDASSIPTNRFGEDERTAFAFGETAKAYGLFLKEARIKEMPVYLATVEKKPFARQAWLLRLDIGNRSGLDGYGRDLDCSSAVRGVRNVEPRSGETASEIYTPSLAEVTKYSQKFVPEVVRKDFEKGLETLFRKQ